MLKNLFKGWFSVSVVGALAVLVMVNVFHGLEQQTGLDSDSALLRAELSLPEICLQQGISASGLMLVDASAPAQGKSAWRFNFRAPAKTDVLTIEVNDRGDARAVPVSGV